MASLISWAGNTVKRVAHDINNDVLNPIQRNVVAPIQHAAAPVVQRAEGAVAQVNPIDSGRTYNSVLQHGAAFQPHINTSGMNQLTHNGLTNLAGSFVKPVIRTSMALNQGIGNAELKLGGRPTQNANQFFKGTGFNKLTGYTGTKRQIAGDVANTALTVGTPGVGKAIDKSFEAVAPKVIPKILTRTVANAGTGAIVGAPMNVASYVGSDQPITKQGLKQSAIQGAQGGALLGAGGTIAGAVGAKAAPVIAKGAKRAVAEPPAVTELRAKKAATIRAMDKAKPSMMKNLVANVNNLDSQIKAIKEGGYAKVPGKEPTSSEMVSDPNNKSLVQPSQRISEQTLSVQPGKAGTGVNRQVGVSSVNPTTNTGLKQRGLTTSVRGSSEVSPALQKAVTSGYTPSNLAEKALVADKAITGNLKQTTNNVIETLAKPTRQLTDQDAANAIGAMKANDAKGNLLEAQHIHDLLAEHGTQHGQFINAFKLLSNRTPDGMLYGARRSLSKAGIKLDEAGDKELQQHIQTIKGTAAGTPERELAIHNLVTFVHNKIPSSAGDKIVNFWRAGLLTSPITTGGNILGNTGEAVVRNLFVNPVATAADKLQSIVTGKRTKTLAGGQTKGAIQGVKDSTTYLKTGFDRNNPLTKIDGKSEINYGNTKAGKVVGKYVNGVYRGLGAQDEPFRQAAASQAALDLAKADAKNLKLKGQARTDYINKAVVDPEWQPQTFKTANTSDAAGAFSVFANETALGKVAQVVKQPFTINGRTYSGALRQFILPFTQVPASIAMRIIHRSDLGAGEIINQIMRVHKGLPYDQRAVSEAIGNGTFGPAAISAGYALSKAGSITGNYPTDPKEKELWKSEGKQANSVHFGNRWYSLNYMQPFGTLLGIGDQIHQDEKGGKSPTEIVSNASARAAKSIESQSFLQGVDGLLSAVNDPQRSAKQYVNSTISSAVPNFVRTTARATDPKQRQTNNVKDALKGSIPGVREGLPAAQDMFGADLNAVDNPVNQLFNPLRPSRAKTTDPVVNELRRLQDTQNGIIPTQFDKSSITGVKLSDKQVRDLNTEVNSKVKTAWQGIMADSRYQALSDEDKATALKQAKDAIGTAYKRQFSAENNLTPGLAKPASASSIQILGGGSPDYLAKSTSAGATASPADKYKAAVAAFNTNSKTMSDVQKYTAQQNIAKLKVEAPYSSDVISLYGMSKAKLNSFINSNPNGKALYNQLSSYDNALYDAGLISSKKFKYGLASGKKSGGKRGSKTAAKAHLTKYASILKSTNAALKPPTPPKSPGITVKVAGAPASYKKTALKQYAVKKSTVSAKRKLA